MRCNGAASSNRKCILRRRKKNPNHIEVIWETENIYTEWFPCDSYANFDRHFNDNFQFSLFRRKTVVLLLLLLLFFLSSSISMASHWEFTLHIDTYICIWSYDHLNNDDDNENLHLKEKKNETEFYVNRNKKRVRKNKKKINRYIMNKMWFNHTHTHPKLKMCCMHDCVSYYYRCIWAIYLL